MLPPNARKGDIMAMLDNAQSEIAKIRRREFDHSTGGIRASEQISVPVKHRPLLWQFWREIVGGTKECDEWERGYFWSHEATLNANMQFRAVEKLLDEILDYLDDHTLRPKTRKHTSEQLSLFRVIKGVDV